MQTTARVREFRLTSRRQRLRVVRSSCRPFSSIPRLRSLAVVAHDFRHSLRSFPVVAAASDYSGSSTKEWAGREIAFMQSNDHPRERRGIWDSTGIVGVAKTFVEEDKEAGSWLKKLQLVKNVLIDQATDEPEVEALALAHIYLSWINQGVLPCVEAGGHYRPKHHAETAKSIFRQLECNIDIHRNENTLVWLSRELHAKLPSFADEFRRAEPLTRIRDIAHRNDIPKDMKHEIKHTLQNKLHRNAGPEDLVAAELMYERILSQQDELNADFVKEYSLFMSELREFFNAGNLAETLRKVRRSMHSVDEAGVHIINRFLELQADLDANYQAHTSFERQSNQLMETMHAVASVRALLLSKLSSGLRNDAPDSALVMRQSYRLAEIRSEEYTFVLMSRFTNLLEKSGSYDALSSGNDRAWALPLGALILGLRNIALTGWEPHECMAIENELSKWHKLGFLSKPANALRMRATLERLQRLASNFCDAILEVFATNAQVMGKALGVSGHHVSVYSESEIRANVVFQVSKLTSFLLKAARHAAGQTAWDTLVPGLSRGRLLEVNTIDSIALPSDIRADEKLILLVKRATGEEDVGHLVSGFTGKGMKVTGIILCQELPHLSHLGVRARQEHLVFTTCTDEDLIRDEVVPLVGNYVELSALPDKVTVYPAHADESYMEDDWKRSIARSSPCILSQFPKPHHHVLPQNQATKESCGAKAANCAVIEDIVSKTNAFLSPKGTCIPYGVMEKTLSAKSLEEIDQLLLEVNHRLDSDGDIDLLVTEIRKRIKCQSVTSQILKAISAAFDDEQKVIVRSSANVEDLAGMSGAGLHDSISNVDPHDPDDLASAILAVWASLHTRRALMARHASGLPHTHARMAILIQEQLFPTLSFVLHTTDPLSKDPNLLSAEIAPGIGETLASGTRGTPWRLTVNKQTSAVETKAFANFSSILMPKGAGGHGWTPLEEANESSLISKVADYSSLALSTEDENRELLGKRLLEVGKMLEAEFGGVPQDIEGALKDNDLYIVQSRPQPL